MSAILDNYHDANGKPIQPYYAAYLILKGFSTPAEARKATCPNGSNADYVIWNSEQWRDFCAGHGIRRDDAHYYRAEFMAWLEARCAAVAIDRAARVAVEGERAAA